MVPIPLQYTVLQHHSDSVFLFYRELYPGSEYFDNFRISCTGCSQIFNFTLKSTLISTLRSCKILTTYRFSLLNVKSVKKPSLSSHFLSEERSSGRSTMTAATTLVEMLLHSENVDWPEVKRYVERRAWLSDCMFLNYIIMRNPSNDVLIWAIHMFKSQLLSYAPCGDPRDKKRMIRAVPLVACCFYGLPDESFELLLFHTINEDPASLTITHLDLIPLNKLKILWNQFPKGVTEYAIDKFLDSASSLDNLEKFEYILKRGLRIKQQPTYNLKHSCLLPHVFLKYILHGATPPKNTGFHTNALNQEFIDCVSLLSVTAPSIIDRMSQKIPQQFTLVDIHKMSCMGVLISNLDHLFSNRGFDKTWVLPLIESLIKANPNLVTSPCLPDGRLPIHFAISKGYFFFKELLKAAPVTLQAQCPVTKLYPFQLAAVGQWPQHYRYRSTTCHFDLAIEMAFVTLKEAPHLVLQNYDTSSPCPCDEERMKRMAFLDLKLERMRRRHKMELDELERERQLLLLANNA